MNKNVEVREKISDLIDKKIFSANTYDSHSRAARSKN